MNRPVKPTFETYPIFEDYMSACGQWEHDIEEYCDELEEKIELINMVICGADTFCGGGNVNSCMHDCDECHNFAVSFVDLHKRLKEYQNE